MTPMPQATAYLSFDGNCAEAMRFYERVLDGKLETMLTVGDSPMAAHSPPEASKRIMHAYLVLNDEGFSGALMAGDSWMGQPYEGMKGFTLTLNYSSVARAQQVFNALAEGGTVMSAMQPSFWAKSFGTLTDRFGTPWIINGEMIAIEGGKP